MNIPFIIKPLRGEAPGEDDFLITHNVDRFSTEDRTAFIKAASEFAEIPLFDGHVEYGYSLEGVADETRCPRCGGGAERRHANFIYMSQKAMRVMYGPVGFFCSKCPTVSVDENLLRIWRSR